MKTAKSLGLLMLFVACHVLAQTYYMSIRVDSHTNQRHITIGLTPYGKVPVKIAVMVTTNDPEAAWQAENLKAMMRFENELKTNKDAHLAPSKPFPQSQTPDSSHAAWMPFKTNLTVDLGEGDGKRQIWLSYWYGDEPKPFGGWEGFDVTLQTAPFTIGILSPPPGITSQPWIQLEGSNSVELKSVGYDVIGPDGKTNRSNEPGHSHGTRLDPDLQKYVADFFTCVDIPLEPGSNTIRLRCTDEAGNVVTTNLTYVFTTAGDTNPPVFSIDWPHPGHEIASSTFTIRGPSDDPTATMVGQITANGRTNMTHGLVERNGYYWFEKVPLEPGPNYVSLTATDVAGNSSSTNFVVYGVTGPVITMDPVKPDSQLWLPSIPTVTGKVVPANNDVWINGVQANVKIDGTWTAHDVPVWPTNSGVAVFDMTSVPSEGLTNGMAKVSQLVSAQASLGTNTMVLNASSPVCGVFQLHLAGTSGRGFVLQASTNLVTWMPILTNSSPDATFDYTDTNANNYHCRFFRVVPLP